MKKIELHLVPTVSRAEMQLVDALMIEKYGISLLQMMENAGRNLADLAQYLLGGTLAGKKIAVCCGGGNNGGGGMAAARHLIDRGAQVCVSVAVDETHMKNALTTQLRILQQMQTDISMIFPDEKFDLIIDSLIGYGLVGAPRGKIAEWIVRLNDKGCTILSLDIPSGMDADNGQAAGVSVRAAATMTLALPKNGMRADNAQEMMGNLFVADISVPSSLLAEMGITMGTLFHDSAIVQIETGATVSGRR